MTLWEDLAQRYATERPVYARLAALVAERSKSSVAKAGILCEINHRAKAVDSFVKKSLRTDLKDPNRPRYPNPIVDIRDKAGVRVIATFEDDLDHVLEAILGNFDCGTPDDKRAELEFDRLGYFAVHVDVSLRDAECIGELTEFRDRSCEVQVQSRAGNLWAEASHDLLYKSALEIPRELQRRVYRLLALVELFDSEMSGTRRLIQDSPDYEDAALLAELEKMFYQLTARRSDRELSIATIRGLRAAFSPSDNRAIVGVLTTFVESNWRKLEQIYQQQAELVVRSPFIFQPESIMIFERLKTAPMLLQDRWRHLYAQDYLAPLGLLFGVAIDT